MSYSFLWFTKIFLFEFLIAWHCCLESLKFNSCNLQVCLIHFDPPSLPPTSSRDLLTVILRDLLRQKPFTSICKCYTIMSRILFEIYLKSSGVFMSFISWIKINSMSATVIEHISLSHNTTWYATDYINTTNITPRENNW